ncbi:MAG: citrate lyase holo-[acyl-carrier protein] synthase [Clostridiaceae bacterium]|nr:citrate lyase holo-[acyl-carrier protein] synthase [Clostridiaceae bacterium]
MRSSTKDGREISLEELLESRDNRRAFQQDLLERYKSPVISFMVNMPGPIKSSSLSRLIHGEGMKALENAFMGRLLHEEVRELDTGFEGYMVLAGDPCEIKRTTCDIEDNHPIGRLMDIDVHTAAGQIGRRQLGLDDRRCLICDRPAPECARSRQHSVEELLAKIEHMAKDYFGE